MIHENNNLIRYKTKTISLKDNKQIESLIYLVEIYKVSKVKWLKLQDNKIKVIITNNFQISDKIYKVNLILNHKQINIMNLNLNMNKIKNK